MKACKGKRDVQENGKGLQLECEDLRKMVWISAPAFAGDGKHGAWLKGISDYNSGTINTYLQEEALEADQEEKVFRSEMLPGYVEKNPVYSPDGRYLAFLASDGRPWQLWVYDRQEDAVKKQTSFRYGVNAPAWSFDGKEMAFEVVWYPGRVEAEAGEMTREEYAAFEQCRREEPKVIETLIYKLDEAYGMLDGSHTAIGICQVDQKGSARILSKKDVSYETPSFSRAGREILCYGFFDAHCREKNAAMTAISIDTGECRKIEKTIPFYYQFPLLEQKGEYLYCGMSTPEGVAMPEVYGVPANGGESRLVFSTEGICHGVDALLVGDTHQEQRSCPIQADEEGNLFFLGFSERRSNIFRFDGTTTEAVTEDECILDFSGPAHGKMLVLKSSWKHPAELFLYEKDEKGSYQAVRQLTEENAWISDYVLTEPIPVLAESKDGKEKIRGWVMMPKAEAAEKSEMTEAAKMPEAGEMPEGGELSEAAETCSQIPAVLDLHGGPEGCYVRGFFFEAQVMAGRGMAVLFCDPRGAAGYGPGFMKEAYAYGQEAVDDFLAFTEECCRQYPGIDPKRIGVTGGSYGGHMTNKLASVTDAFAAAVAQRTWVNPSTSYGTGDMGFYSAGGSGTFLEYMEGRVHRSIMKYVKNIHIPFLILHGEQDYRCALEQGEQVYHVLRSVSPELPVKIVIFPEENHGVTRGGKLHNQIRHMKEMADWFSAFLVS